MTIALILGHSFCKWLERHLRLGSDHRLVPSFNITECCKVHMKGVGGRTIDKLMLHDMHDVHAKSPDIVILMIGDNDVNADTSPEAIAHKMVVLATFLHGKYKVSHIVLCQLMPRFSEKLRNAGIEGIFNQSKEISDIVRAEVAAYDYITPQVRKKFRCDGINLSPKGQWHHYKSIRGALLSASYKLQHERATTTQTRCGTEFSFFLLLFSIARFICVWGYLLRALICA
ncbi:hypothetical protein ACJMK2_013421 [Sinanodonta woodiana]|uniref:SGNH hydrolase-type esterase domain-containing protein n=1 Tax=Sinanodonta woodiana TaxID=1069815 RepID=A0ABD3V0M3_SINWO